ncbi:unnamed protein product [Arabis nemorensis]|uniref:Uncharacterized protein n=1 Tax=Arabis nemorensis TaxID=586526 RepID=A0A565CDN1_9BRAS|nr:unnamed protein product [Arabis nemorensis]
MIAGSDPYKVVAMVFEELGYRSAIDRMSFGAYGECRSLSLPSKAVLILFTKSVSWSWFGLSRLVRGDIL